MLDKTSTSVGADRRTVLRTVGGASLATIFGSMAASPVTGSEETDEDSEEDGNVVTSSSVSDESASRSTPSIDTIEPVSGDNWSPTGKTFDLGSEGSFHNGITTHGGEVYTLDNSSNRVYRYTEDFELIEEINPSFGGSGLHRGITHHAGKWYTVRQGNGINVFDEEWNFERFKNIDDDIYDIRWYDDRFYVSDRNTGGFFSSSAYIHEYTEDLELIQSTELTDPDGFAQMYVIEGKIYGMEFRGETVYQYTTDYDLEEAYELESDFDNGPTGIGLVDGRWYLNDDSDGELFEYHADYHEESESDEFARYTDENGFVDSEGLLNAGRDFRNGEINTETLNEVTTAFRTGEPLS